MKASMPEAPRPAQPWWSHRMVWLVIAGPAIVVVASFATLTLALVYPDPPLATAFKAADDAAAPALQGRNHAATPVPSSSRP